MRLAAPALLVACAAAGTALATPRTAIVLAPISADTVNHCDPTRLETALKTGLRRGKRFQLVTAAGREAVRLEVLECAYLDERRTSVEYEHETHRERGGRIAASEKTIGIESESVRTAILRARLVAESRFIEVASGPDDPDLEKAVATIRRAIDKALADRGRWLIEGRHTAR